MGRAARECTEPRADRPAARRRSQQRREPGLLGCYDGFAVGFATVDPGFEAAANVLTRREKGVVTRASRWELHDTDGLVTIAVAACVGGRLIEGYQAIALPPKPCHPRTPTTS
jgi:hypothetical protein